MSESQQNQSSIDELKDECYKPEEEPTGLQGDRYLLIKDDTATLMENLCFLRNQLYQEILESFGIPLQETDSEGRKSLIDDIVDTDPSYSIKYDNEAYVEEEKAYAENRMGTLLNNSQIDHNKSIGDLIVSKFKNGLLGYGSDIDLNGYVDLVGFIGKLPDKIGNWRIKDTIKWLENNTGNATMGRCAEYVRRGLEAGGISTEGRPGEAKGYIEYLPSIGFKLVRYVKYNQNYANYMKYEASPGDIAVMRNPKGGYGHICLYTGKQWISDFKQPRAWVYGGQCGLLYIFRYEKMTEMIKEQLADIGTAIKGWGVASVNGLSMMIACEGWTDGSKKNNYGIPGTDAVAAGQSKIDKAGTVTVGPGITNKVSSAIRPGVKFTGKQIMALWSTTIVDFSKTLLRLCPNIAKLPQRVKDMALDALYNCGQGAFAKAGWSSVKTPEDAARACLRMPMTAKGKPSRGLIDRRNAEAKICLGQQATGSAKRYTDAYYHPYAKVVALLK